MSLLPVPAPIAANDLAMLGHHTWFDCARGSKSFVRTARSAVILFRQAQFARSRFDAEERGLRVARSYPLQSNADLFEYVLTRASLSMEPVGILEPPPKMATNRGLPKRGGRKSAR
jgi:hypothetical protein